MASSTRSQDRFGLESAPPKPRSDAYTGLMAVSLVAMIIGSVLLYLDWSQYTEMKPPSPPPPAAKGAPAPAPAPPPAMP